MSTLIASETQSEGDYTVSATVAALRDGFDTASWNCSLQAHNPNGPLVTLAQMSDDSAQSTIIATKVGTLG